MTFRDRVDAGRLLAEVLRGDIDGDVVVLGVPRGGVPVAAQVAQALGAPLDVVVVRKLGVPHRSELAMGAIGEQDVRVLDGEVIRRCQVSDDSLAAVEAEERAELSRRAAHYRAGRDRSSLVGCTALIVDDGMATGSTAQAAAQVVRQLGASRVVVAVPVAARQAVRELRRDAEQVVAVQVPEPFGAVGRWYDDFDPISDAEVLAGLASL